MLAGLITVAAIGGKIGGAVLAALRSGQKWKESLGLGALLNTRGLVEPVVLNVAYNAGADGANYDNVHLPSVESS